MVRGDDSDCAVEPARSSGRPGLVSAAGQVVFVTGEGEEQVGEAVEAGQQLRADVLPLAAGRRPGVRRGGRPCAPRAGRPPAAPRRAGRKWSAAAGPRPRGRSPLPARQQSPRRCARRGRCARPAGVARSAPARNSSDCNCARQSSLAAPRLRARPSWAFNSSSVPQTATRKCVFGTRPAREEQGRAVVAAARVEFHRSQTPLRIQNIRAILLRQIDQWHFPPARLHWAGTDYQRGRARWRGGRRTARRRAAGRRLPG